MNNLYDDDQEKLLSLSLATNNVSDTDHRNKKRKRTIKRSSSSLSTSINNNNNNNSYEYHESFQSKVLRLIQTREEMLRQGQFCQYHQQNNSASGGLHLIHLLLVAAAATSKCGAGVAAASSALESLRSLYSGASLTGDSVQRVAAHFADALAARLLTRKSPFFHVIMKGPTAEEELSAFAGLYRASPLFQFAHFTANQAILEAMNNDSINVHVIDLDVSYGFQWPSLIQSLADQKTPSLRITGFGASAGKLRETEERLVSFARGFRNLSFEFRGVLSLGYDEDFRGLKESIRENEILAVNLVLNKNTNNDNSTTLFNMVRSLNPTVVVLVEREVVLSSPSFVARFVESLHYFAAMFDSLDDSLPSDSGERLSIEKNHLGTQIKALLNQDDLRRRSSAVVMSWRERMESHGFRGVKMSSKAVIQAKLLLKMRTNNGDHYGSNNNDDNSNFCGGFRVSERDEGMAISLGWQNRYLITASVWHCLL